jgi:hypothetical protein
MEYSLAILILFDPQMLAPTQTVARLVVEFPTLLYVGPDQILPFASVLSAIAGIALMFWNRLVSLVGKGWALVSRRGPAEPVTPRESTD